MANRVFRTFRYKNAQTSSYHSKGYGSSGGGSIRSRRSWNRIKFIMSTLIITSSIAGTCKYSINLHFLRGLMSCATKTCTLFSYLIADLLGFSTQMVEANPDAKRLYDDLLSNYNRLIRPVANNTEKLTVKLGLKLSQLIDVVSQPKRQPVYFLSK